MGCISQTITKQPDTGIQVKNVIWEAVNILVRLGILAICIKTKGRIWYCKLKCIKNWKCINKVHFTATQCRVTCIGVGCVQCVKECISNTHKGSHSCWIQCWPSQRIRSQGRKAKHLSFSHLYYVAETSTPSKRVVPEHPRTPTSSPQGLHFCFSMK